MALPTATPDDKSGTVGKIIHLHQSFRFMAPEQPPPDTRTVDSFLALLRSRRTIVSFQRRPVPGDLVRKALDAGRFAPNHKLTEPWRFTVIGEETRRIVEEGWADFATSRLSADATSERRDEARRASLEKVRGKPAIVIVTQTLDPDPVRREEDYAAVAAAIQNIQLAAWAMGLGCQWSTSAATRAPVVLAPASIPSTERVVGFLFLGYPAVVPEVSRKPLDVVARWLP